RKAQAYRRRCWGCCRVCPRAFPPMGCGLGRSVRGRATRTPSGSSTGVLVDFTTTGEAPSSLRRSPSVVERRHLFWCSIRTAILCAPGALQARAMNGRSPTMASTWTTKATFGSVATARRMRTFSNSPRTASSCCRLAAPARMLAATIPRISGALPRSGVDPKTNEAYIADGYLNKRVAVIDADTGKMKRYWGAYGNRPDDTNLGPYDPSAPPA